jgi:hypothetical protein
MEQPAEKFGVLGGVVRCGCSLATMIVGLRMGKSAKSHRRVAPSSNCYNLKLQQKNLILLQEVSQNAIDCVKKFTLIRSENFEL